MNEVDDRKLTYRIAEAAEALGVSRDMIYAALRDGSLRKLKLGAVTLIEAAELRRFLAALADEAPPR